jgi:5-methyltetrahydropteroyltriglutamate--homocysteine methyltransferase
VVAATRGLDRGRVDRDAVERAFDDDLAALIKVQREAGLDFFSDGLLKWQDIFRPLVEGLGPKPPEELVRWFDTNTFFRAPELSTVDQPRASAAAPMAAVPDPRVVTLPSPYTFSRAAHNATDRNRLMQELAERLLRPAMRNQAAAGAGLIHLEEPWLTYYGIEDADWQAFAAAVDSMTTGVPAKVILHCYFGDAGPYIERLKQLRVHGIGVDLVETDVAALGRGWEDRALLIGCLDGRSSVVESIEDTVDAIRHIADTARPLDLYLSSTCELQYLPTAVAERKVRRLGEVAHQAKELVSV